MAHAVVHFELAGPEPRELARFYAGLFGWSVRPVPGLDYALIDTRAGAGINGGLAGSNDRAGSAVFYIEADLVQDVLDKINLLGGKTATPISDLGDLATLARFEDPDGLIVGLLLGAADPGPAGPGRAAAVPGTEQPAGATVPGLAGLPAPSAGTGAAVDWFEVLGSDAADSQRFYAEVFGWTIDGAPSASAAGGYRSVLTGSAHGIRGGIGAGRPDRWATVYARVPDVEAALVLAADLGGGREAGPVAVGDITTGALRDPAGNLFGVYSPAAADAGVSRPPGWRPAGLYRPLT